MAENLRTEALRMDADVMLPRWAHLLKVCEPISQWTTGLELCWLAEAVQGLACVGEVGSYKGKSAKAMAMAGAGRVWCVDHFQDETKGTFCANLEEELWSGRVQLLDMESAAGAETCGRMGVRFDLFFIDASHRKEDVLRDMQLWLPRMKPGGILCGHDYHPGDADNGVALALREKLRGFWNPVDSIWAWRVPGE